MHRAGVVGDQHVEVREHAGEAARGRGRGRSPGGACRSPRGCGRRSTARWRRAGEDRDLRRRVLAAQRRASSAKRRHGQRLDGPNSAPAKSPTSGDRRRSMRPRAQPLGAGGAAAPATRRAAASRRRARDAERRRAARGSPRSAGAGRARGRRRSWAPAGAAAAPASRRDSPSARGCRPDRASQAERMELGSTIASSQPAARRRCDASRRRRRHARPPRRRRARAAAAGARWRLARATSWRSVAASASSTGSAITQSPTQFGITTSVRRVTTGLAIVARRPLRRRCAEAKIQLLPRRNTGRACSASRRRNALARAGSTYDSSSWRIPGGRWPGVQLRRVKEHQPHARRAQPLGVDVAARRAGRR